jgi:hypothetical protein
MFNKRKVVIFWLITVLAVFLCIQLVQHTQPASAEIANAQTIDNVTNITLVGKWRTYWTCGVTETEMQIFPKKGTNTPIAEYSFSFINDLNYVIKGEIYGQLLDKGKVLRGRFKDETGSGPCSFYLSSDNNRFDGEWSIDGRNSYRGQWIGKKLQ